MQDSFYVKYKTHRYIGKQVYKCIRIGEWHNGVSQPSTEGPLQYTSLHMHLYEQNEEGLPVTAF